MTHITRTFRAGCLLPLAAATLAFAADANTLWNGTWKLNPGKSKLTGSVDHIQQAPDGKWTVTTAGVSFSFACDGKEYPIIAGRTQICHQVDDNTIDTVLKANGQELAHVKRSLSDGAQTLTVVETGTAPNGTPFHSTELYKRVGSGQGWVGTWRNTKVQESNNGVAIVEASADTIKFTYPMQQSTLTAKLDGTPTREQGPRVAAVDVRLRAAGPRTLQEEDSLDGKPIEHDTWTLSPDGKTITLEALRTGDPEKQVYVFDKQ